MCPSASVINGKDAECVGFESQKTAESFDPSWTRVIGSAGPRPRDAVVTLRLLFVSTLKVT